jgi:tRNA-splicing ligase RtcB
MPDQIKFKLLSWADELEPGVIEQAAKTAKLSFVAGHVALMPDAHVGIGSTVGSVIPTKGAIMPAAVGVDIGCGMVASETNLTQSDLPWDLDKLMPLVEQRIPAGVGKGFEHVGTAYTALDKLGLPYTPLTQQQNSTVACQFGTLGSGNHFVEVCVDERGVIWTVLHSGSRGIGNQLARVHIEGAKGLMKQWHIHLEDPDLAYLVQGTPAFDNYITDMLWCQDYAMQSRAMMNKAITRSLFEIVGEGQVVRTINCHHNFTQQENHHGQNLWITRKGAIKADVGDEGVIPGSMGTGTYITTGLGNPASYNSSSHGAGRKMSRAQARRTLTTESLATLMNGITWNADKAVQILDEHPESYKSIEKVMAAQKDLTSVQHVLHQLFNYKGAR